MRMANELASQRTQLDAEYQTQIATNAAEIACLQRKLADSDDKVAFLSDALSRSESRVCSLLIDADKAQRSSEESISRIARLESQLHLANERIQTLEANEQSFASQIAEVHTAFLEADDRRSELEGLLGILSEENCKAKLVNDGLQTRIADCAPIEMLSKDNLS